MLMSGGTGRQVFSGTGKSGYGLVNLGISDVQRRQQPNDIVGRRHGDHLHIIACFDHINIGSPAF